MENIEQSPDPSTASRIRATLIKFVAVLWRFFANPLLLLAVSSFALMLVLAAMAVPQIPDSLQADPAATARWMLDATASYAATGSLLKSLEIFNLLRSDLLRFLLVLIALMLSVQFADQLGQTLALKQLPKQLQAPVAEVGTALSLPYSGTVHRFRVAAAVEEEPLARQVYHLLVERFDRVQEALATKSLDEDAGPEASDSDAVSEERLLALRNQVAAYLRPLLLFGLLVGLLGLWLNVIFGWEVITPSLSPMASFSYPLRDLAIGYPAADQGGTGVAPVLQIDLGDAQQNIAVDDVGRVGQASVIVRPSAPALLVRAEPSGVLLARSGDSTKVATLGLAFPEPGREESLVLPDQAMGVRIVRQPNNQYGIEIYEAGSATPIERITLEEDDVRAVELPGTDVTVSFVPTVGAVAAVRSKPGDPLYWLAGLLILVGLFGFVRNPAFLMAQVAIWSPDKSVVVAQSNAGKELDILRRQIQQSGVED